VGASQVRLVLRGNGRVTPRLHAARVAYPRFVPAPLSTSRTWKIQRRPILPSACWPTRKAFDRNRGRLRYGQPVDLARAPNALDWLAGWWGCCSTRSGARSSSAGFGTHADRRRLFIRFARKLYERRHSRRHPLRADAADP
jgi:hypothetical protein